MFQPNLNDWRNILVSVIPYHCLCEENDVILNERLFHMIDNLKFLGLKNKNRGNSIGFGNAKNPLGSNHQKGNPTVKVVNSFVVDFILEFHPVTHSIWIFTIHLGRKLNDAYSMQHTELSVDRIQLLKLI